MSVRKKLYLIVLPMAIAGIWALPPYQPVRAQEQSPVAVPELTVEDRQQLRQRLETRKANRQIRLTTAQATRLRQRCSAAQTKLQSPRSQLSELRQKHRQAYVVIVERLEEIISYVGDRADIQPLQAATAELQSRIDVYNTLLDDYELLMADLVNQNCSEDPAAFQASLEAAREARQKLVAQRADIRAYLQDNVKPLIDSLKKALAVS